jgi:hypothetical protein
MKTKFAAACFLTGALMLPGAGYTADNDMNRLSPTAMRTARSSESRSSA